MIPTVVQFLSSTKYKLHPDVLLHLFGLAGVLRMLSFFIYIYNCFITNSFLMKICIYDLISEVCCTCKGI